jgi:hypothetical protein
MTTTPDGISFAELQSHLEDAPKEDSLQKQAGVHGGLTREQLIDCAEAALTELTNVCPDPLIHKFAAIRIMENMQHWHRTIADKMIEDGEIEAGLAWSRDAGKFQSILNILFTIGVGPKDFTAINLE